MSLPEQEEPRTAEDQELEEQAGQQTTNLPSPPLVSVGPLTDESLTTEPGEEDEQADVQDDAS